MCKKLLSGLFGGGAAPAPVPVAVAPGETSKEGGEVKDTSTAITVGDRVTGSGVNAGVVDDKRKKGVPGLGL